MLAASWPLALFAYLAVGSYLTLRETADAMQALSASLRPDARRTDATRVIVTLVAYGLGAWLTWPLTLAATWLTRRLVARDEGGEGRPGAPDAPGDADGGEG